MPARMALAFADAPRAQPPSVGCQALQFPIQGTRTHRQAGRQRTRIESRTRPRPSQITLLQCGQRDHLTERKTATGHRRLGRRQVIGQLRQVWHINEFAIGEQRGPFDQIAQFADIPGIAPPREPGQRRWRKTSAVLAIDALEQGFSEQGNVARSLMQRRRVNGKGIDPEVSTDGLTPGYDTRDRYPSVRSFTFGVNVKF